MKMEAMLVPASSSLLRLWQLLWRFWLSSGGGIVTLREKISNDCLGIGVSECTTQSLGRVHGGGEREREREIERLRD